MHKVIGIGLETIIANLVYRDLDNKGITFSDISHFMYKLLQELENTSIYCELNLYNLERVLKIYNHIFKKYQDRIYLKKEFDLKYFNKGYSPSLEKLFLSI